MKRITLLLLIAAACCQIYAQNTTNSPSSMFGIGELSMGEGGIFAGMGGVNYALRDANNLNTTNPASLTGLGSKKFMVNVGVFGGVKQFSQNNATNNSFVGNASNIGIGFRSMPKWYTAVSFTPVSSVGYNITIDDIMIDGTSAKISSLFEGSGGISRINFSNAFQVTNQFSVGANVSYLLGRITEKETQGTAAEEIVSRKKAFYADFGAQYVYPLKKKDETLTLGVVYGISQRIAQRNTRTVASSNTSSTIDETLTVVKQYMPAYYGVGVAYNSPRWIMSGDYRYSDWSKMVSKISYISYNNQHRIALGASYRLGNLYKLPKHVQFGAGYYNSYVTIKGKEAQNYYVSAGGSITTIGGTILSLGLKYNDQLNLSKSDFKERTISFYFNVAFNERSIKFKLK